MHLVHRVIPRVLLVLHKTYFHTTTKVHNQSLRDFSRGLNNELHIDSSYIQKLVEIQTLYIFENLHLPLFILFCRKISTHWKWNYCMTCNYCKRQNYKYLCYRYAYLSYCILGNSDEGNLINLTNFDQIVKLKLFNIKLQ